MADAGDPARAELGRQARIVRALGSPFVAGILEASQRQIDRAPRVAAFIADWPGHPGDGALAMRLNAALHALARRAPSSSLGQLYAGAPLDLDSVIGATIETNEAFIADWMVHAPQTNEVGRAGAVMAALMVLRSERAMPVELLELGASGGLNLNLVRYRHELGGVLAGDPRSAVRIAPDWSGPAPPDALVEVLEARGVDLQPLDSACPAARERLIAYVFVDQPARAERLNEALTLARTYPPLVDRGDATSWLACRLAAPQPEGQCRVVVHSMVMQYLDGVARRRAGDLMNAAAARATVGRPLGRIGFEWNPKRSEVQLTLTSWPGTGGPRVLATCHPYGASIDWHGAA